jgi:hypothetical protein
LNLSLISDSKAMENSPKKRKNTNLGLALNIFGKKKNQALARF